MKKQPKLPIYNATERIRITVLAEDIRKGKRKDHERCAAALACLREVPHCTRARVGNSVTILTLAAHGNVPAHELRCKTPVALRNELIPFDRAGKMAPGTFTLAPRQPSHRPTGRRLGGVGQGGKSGRKRQLRHIAGTRMPLQRLG